MDMPADLKARKMTANTVSGTAMPDSVVTINSHAAKPVQILAYAERYSTDPV